MTYGLGNPYVSLGHTVYQNNALSTPALTCSMPKESCSVSLYSPAPAARLHQVMGCFF